MKAGLIPDNKKIAKEKKEAAEQEKVEQENAEREIPSQPEQEVDLPEENRSVQVWHSQKTWNTLIITPSIQI